MIAAESPGVFVAGGTGYPGSRLIPLLARRGYSILALVRPGSERKLPVGAVSISGRGGGPRGALRQRERRAAGAGHEVLSAGPRAARTRARGEGMIRSGFVESRGGTATILRPWYVLGPGPMWPHLLRPLYAFWERIPATAETTRRIGLVRLPEMLASLADAVGDPPPARTVRIVDVPAIRAGGVRTRATT